MMSYCSTCVFCLIIFDYSCDINVMITAIAKGNEETFLPLKHMTWNEEYQI